jgi:hypothetical protein
MRGTALAIPLLLLVTACGADTGIAAGAARPAGGEGDVPITPAAIAAVAVDHLPDGPSSTEATYTDEQHPKGYRGADFRYRAGAGEDGDLVRVTLTPHVDPNPCRPDFYDGCEELDAPDGARMFLIWTEVVPEEDPGSVAVLLQRPHEDVRIMSAGRGIEGDPRDQDLPVAVSAMEDLVRDDRLHLMATQEVVDAGEDLADWGG